MTATLKVNTIIGETAPSNLGSENYANDGGEPFAGVNTLYMVTTSTFGTPGAIKPQYTAIGYNNTSGWMGIGDNNKISATMDKTAVYSPAFLIQKNNNLYLPFTPSLGFNSGFTIFNLSNSESVFTSPDNISIIASLYLQGYWLAGDISNNTLGLMDETATFLPSSVIIPNIGSVVKIGQISIGTKTFFTLQGPSRTNSSGNEFFPVYLVEYNGSSLSLIQTYNQFASISPSLFNLSGVPLFFGTDADTYEQYYVTPNGATYFNGSVGTEYIDSFDGSSGEALIASYYSETAETEVLCGITDIVGSIIKQKSPMTSLYPPFSLVLANGWMGFGVNSDNTLYPVTIDFSISVPVNEIHPTRNFCHNYSRGVPVNYGGNLTLPATYNARLKP